MELEAYLEPSRTPTMEKKKKKKKKQKQKVSEIKLCLKKKNDKIVR